MPKAYLPREVVEAFNTISAYKAETQRAVKAAGRIRDDDWSDEAKHRVQYRRQNLKAVNNALATVSMD